MLLTLAFALFSIVVLISFVMTCLPVQLSTEGGRADQRGVHVEPYNFCIDDIETESISQQISSEETTDEQFASVDEEPLEDDGSLVMPTQNTEPLKEAA